MEYLKASLALGDSKDVIYRELISKGWSDETIQEGFNLVETGQKKEDFIVTQSSAERPAIIIGVNLKDKVLYFFMGGIVLLALFFALRMYNLFINIFQVNNEVATYFIFLSMIFMSFLFARYRHEIKIISDKPKRLTLNIWTMIFWALISLVFLGYAFLNSQKLGMGVIGFVLAAPIIVGASIFSYGLTRLLSLGLLKQKSFSWKIISVVVPLLLLGVSVYSNHTNPWCDDFDNECKRRFASKDVVWFCDAGGNGYIMDGSANNQLYDSDGFDDCIIKQAILQNKIEYCQYSVGGYSPEEGFIDDDPESFIIAPVFELLDESDKVLANSPSNKTLFSKKGAQKKCISTVKNSGR